MLRFVSSNNAMVFSIGSPSNERTGFIQVGHADANNYAHVTSALHLNKLGGTVYINNNVAWHAGNDGSGSGLDADLLDGNHASAFATAGHTHNYDNVYSKLGHTHDDRYYTESEINSSIKSSGVTIFLIPIDMVIPPFIIMQS